MQKQSSFDQRTGRTTTLPTRREPLRPLTHKARASPIHETRQCNELAFWNFLRSHCILKKLRVEPHHQNLVSSKYQCSSLVTLSPATIQASKSPCDDKLLVNVFDVVK
ncbi:hypothetical protein LR48_Vigan10g030000 [Vigna angularis]|uniref:Uncharacterized protein n=1 Tax=Phaseolus angularis TaxID=3914 RepID=A0A0L9VHD2_PHAAN|nr:hypothetical protein LR48_Vigan10g030000 [Vigna angularis]